MEELSEIMRLIDCVICLIIDGYWLDDVRIYSGLPLGFRHPSYVPFLWLKLTSRKSTSFWLMLLCL